jgi:hypothetical protein
VAVKLIGELVQASCKQFSELHTLPNFHGLCETPLLITSMQHMIDRTHLMEAGQPSQGAGNSRLVTQEPQEVRQYKRNSNIWHSRAVAVVIVGTPLVLISHFCTEIS